MKKYFSYTTLLLLFTTVFAKTSVQAQAISQSFKESSVQRINQLINDNYVFPEVAKATSEHLSKKLQEGRFDTDTTAKLFALSLTKELQSINHDKHMRVLGGAPSSPTRPVTQNNNGGFKEVKLLEGNIGYIDMRLFFAKDIAASFADEHMKTLANADAIIIDLRNNGGGEPEMVQYLCSYFFSKKVHLNSLYWRRGDRTEEFWTVDVAGKKLPDVPLFILTGPRTFSGAEEFSYNMQTQKRATLIGETTGGGANPGGVFRINDEMNIFIPTGTAINPITKTNWEGTGVKPDIAVTADKVLEEAIPLAREAAKKYTGVKRGF